MINNLKDIIKDGLRLNNICPKEKQKLYLVFAVLGAAGIILFFSIFLKPQFARFSVMNREYYKFRAEVKNDELLIADRDRIKAQYETIKQQALVFEKIFPGQDEISSLLGDFSLIAESSGVKILKIMPIGKTGNLPEQTETNVPYYELPILIESIAGYHQCGIFVNKIESMDRFIKIDKLEISGKTETPRVHGVRLEVTAYVIK